MPQLSADNYLAALRAALRGARAAGVRGHDADACAADATGDLWARGGEYADPLRVAYVAGWRHARQLQRRRGIVRMRSLQGLRVPLAAPPPAQEPGRLPLLLRALSDLPAADAAAVLEPRAQYGSGRRAGTMHRYRIRQRLAAAVEAMDRRAD